MEKKNLGVQRESWTSRFGFVMAAAGSAVGLGNIWRFPYLTGENGGAVFLIIYLFAALLIGFTVMICEFAIGRKAQANAIGSFRKIAPGTYWWITGLLGVLAAFTILSFYGVVAGWTMAYFWKTLSGVFSGVPAGDLPDIFVGFIANPIEPILWQAAFMAITIVIVAAGIRHGIEMWSKILMPATFAILIILIIRSVTLQGSWEGIVFFLRPDFSAVTGSTFLAALGQAFFTLSLGMGCMITYGSYLGGKENLSTSALQVIGLDTAVAVLAGFAIFPAVFAVGLAPDSGPGLVFMLLPAVFETIPFGTFFGALFFLLLAIAALTSAISLLEVAVAFVKEQWGFERKPTSVVVGIVIFIIGAIASLSNGVLSHIPFPMLGQPEPLNFFDFLDHFSADLLLPVGGLLISLFVIWVWKPENFFKELTNDGEIAYGWIPAMKVLAGIIAPIIIFAVLLNALGIF